MDKATHDKMRQHKALFEKRHPVYYVARAIAPWPKGAAEIPWLIIVPDGDSLLGSRIHAIGRDEADMWRKANIT